MKENAILQVSGIEKYFPGVHALKAVDLDIQKAEVHSIVGENGAGKSTLIKILAGVNKKDAGEYYFEGEKVDLHSVHQAIEMGVSCIYQELTIVPMIDVAQNIFLGNLPMKKGRVDYKKLYSDSEDMLKILGMDVSPYMLAIELSIAQQQMIEIGRAISRNAKVIIMDEPTSSLTDKEIRILFEVIASLKARGVSVIYISHKLEEVKEISDRITVFRDGEKISTFANDENATPDMIIQQMIGRKIENYFNKTETEIGDVVLEVKNYARKNKFHKVNFSVRQGEVLGFFGLVGAGRSEIMCSLFGIDELDEGETYISGNPVKIKNAQTAIENGLGFVPEDRKLQGLVTKMDIKSNEMMVQMNRMSKWGVIDIKAEDELAVSYAEQLSIKTPSLRKPVGELSGGNQQKVCIAKWLMTKPKVLILDEPTRGIDVGAKSDIYSLINKLAQSGVAIIVVSSELLEILGVCDRVITICNGEITGDLNMKEVDSAKVMQAALGIGGAQ